MSIALLVVVFAASGAAGLMYESLWSRYLGLFVGHSAYAQIIVLSIFLGGMSLGAHLAGRWSRRIRQPLIWYAGIELVVAVLAFFFHAIFLAVTAFAYDGIFQVVSGPALVGMKWALAGLIILPQSILLGATFPLMSAGVLRLAGGVAPGRILSLLYFANSIGAAAGALIAGLWLVGAVGLPGTMVIAGTVNVAVALTVAGVVLARSRSLGGMRAEIATWWAVDRTEPVPQATPDAAAAGAALARMLLVVAFGTAVASFIYEIAWIRMLSLVFGSSTHSFEIMLSAFILGLALGALWVRGRADQLGDPVRFLGWVQCAMGVLAIATLPLYVLSFDWMATTLASVARTDEGYRVFTLVRYALAIAIMLPATLCAGMTLPLMTKVLLSWRGERAIGAVYAVNTLGSIVGVVLAGLLLMPLLGVKRLLVVGACLDVALGLWLLAHAARALSPSRADRRSATQRLAILAATTAVVMLAIMWYSRLDTALLASGVYRTGVPRHEASARFLFYKDGRTASVSVKRNSNGLLSLATNGKPDASMDPVWLNPEPPANRVFQLARDDGTQLLLPLIALGHRPQAHDIAVIGYGSGISSHVLLGSPFAQDVVTIEIEPMMVAGARLFWPANRRAIEDGRSRIVIDDARAYFASSQRRWDLIMSEPSNPWVSGASNLFSVEFYRHVKRQLSPGGVFAQWLQLYELSDSLANSVLAAIDTVFPAYEVFFTSKSDIVVVASDSALQEPDWGIIDYPGIRKDLTRAVPFGPEWFETMRLGGRVVLSPMLGQHQPLNSDYRPVLEQRAEHARFVGRGAIGYGMLPSSAFDVVSALSGRKLGFGASPVTPTPEVTRSAKLAFSTRLRGHLYSLAPGPLSDTDERLKSSLYRHDAMMRLVTSGRPPVDWRLWLRDVRLLQEELHAGTAGVADTVFFANVRRYLVRVGAPTDVRAAVDLLHGLSAWNWPEAARASKLLLAHENKGEWIPAPLLRDGAATAFIMTRDTAAARQVLGLDVGRYDESLSKDILTAIMRSIDRRAVTPKASN